MNNRYNSIYYQKEGLGVKTLETIEETFRYNRWISKKILPYLGEENLELGAGLGTLSAIIAEKKKIHLCELSEYNRKKLSERFDKNNYVGDIFSDFLQYPHNESLDAIYSSNVLEHIENDVEIIQKAASLLKIGSAFVAFVAFVPAGKWLYSKFDIKIGHLRRYGIQDRKRFQNFINEQNLSLKIEKFSFYNPVGALGWFIKMKLLRKTEINKKDALLFDRILPFISWLDIFSSFLWGQNLLIVIRKIGSFER